MAQKRKLYLLCAKGSQVKKKEVKKDRLSLFMSVIVPKDIFRSSHSVETCPTSERSQLKF